MYPPNNGQILHKETTCGSLFSELQKICDEIGESSIERDKMLVELEQECLEAYRRKVDQARQYRAHLRQAVADSEAELALICSALGEGPIHISQQSRKGDNLKKELEAIIPQVEEMRKRKSERKEQFVEVIDQICSISDEIRRPGDDLCGLVVDEDNMSLKRLEELQNQLLALQKEKSDRLKRVMDNHNTLNSLCVVLGMEYKVTLSQIYPSLDDPKRTYTISSEIIERLSSAIYNLQELKIQRMRRLQDLATTMVELWSLMDTPLVEQQMFQNVTKNIAASEDEIIEPNMLSVDFLNFAEAEVSRLQQMKSSKMKEVLLRKRLELEEICRTAHMVADSSEMNYPIEAIESGGIDPSYLLDQIELQISNVKEEAFSRRDILDRVEKWLAARNEESWLEEYNRDDNRYNAGRGTHLILKRAEKARALVNKIPALVEALTSKAREWENERGAAFFYDGVHLLTMLEQYNVLKQEKDNERRRQRDQKKLQGQLITEQEALFGSKPSPSKSGKKGFRSPSIASESDKRFSLGGLMLQTSILEKTAGRPSHLTKKSNFAKRNLSQNKYQGGGGFAAPSSGTSNAHKIETTPVAVRSPLSPVLSTLLLSNTEDENIIQTWKIQETHAKKISADNYEEDENKTPKKLPIPMPSTPSSVSSSSAMQTTAASTPAAAAYIVHPRADGNEYSFEERRAAFILTSTNSK